MHRSIYSSEFVFPHSKRKSYERIPFNINVRPEKKIVFLVIREMKKISPRQSQITFSNQINFYTLIKVYT